LVAFDTPWIVANNPGRASGRRGHSKAGERSIRVWVVVELSSIPRAMAADYVDASPAVSGILLRALADTAMRFEVPPSALLSGVPHALSVGAPMDVRVPLLEFGRMLERAAALTGEPAIGLLCGFEASECAFDLLAPLVSHTSSLRHALQVIHQFHSLAFDGVRTRLTETAGVACIRCDFPRAYDSTDRNVAEFVMGGLVRMLRLFGSTKGDLHAAYFEHKRPARSHAHARIFHGCERFSQPYTALEFSAQLLDRTHLHANPELQTSAHVQAEQHLHRLTRPAPFIESLRRHLLNQPPPGVPSMEEAARAFGVSVRSLRRRLTEAGVSYRNLTQEMQAERACMMLRNPDSSVQAVADALGFADTGAFYRAFRRWTGMSAGEYAARLHPPS
jgi:AraC-like DNA-binding protein